MIYFIKENGTDFIKIGFTADLRTRILNLSQGNPRKLNVFRLIEDAEKGDEQLLFDYYKKFEINNNWFYFQDDMQTINVDDLKIKSVSDKLEKETKRKEFKRRVNEDIEKVINQLLNFDRLYIDEETISAHLNYTQNTIIDNIDKTQRCRINSHNVNNFGVDNKDDYNKIKDLSRSLLSNDSISKACEDIGVSIKEYMKYKNIIFGNYNYVHFDLNENEYYF